MPEARSNASITWGRPFVDGKFKKTLARWIIYVLISHKLHVWSVPIMNHVTLRLAGLLAALVALTAGRASATTLTDSQIFGQFNAVIFDNFSASSEVEGRTVVGGNVTGGSNFEIHTGLEASTFGALTVYGNVTDSGSLNIDNGGSVTIAGSNSASFNLNTGGSAYVGGNNSGTLTGGSGSLGVIGTNSGALSLANGGSVYVGNGNAGSITANGGTNTVQINGNNSGSVSLNNSSTMQLNGSNTGTIVQNGGSLSYTGSAGNVTNVNNGPTKQVSSVTLTAPTSTLGSFASTFQTQLTALSSQLSGMAANSTATVSNGVVSFNASPNSSGVAVFNVNFSLFSGASTVQINLDGATSVIINVNVDSCASNVCILAANFENPTDYASAVLWNFANATNLNFTTEFGGSILAPEGTVYNSAAIDGTLVAANDSGSGGELHSYPYTGTFPGSPTAAPEPASLALVGSGIAGLAAIRRRRLRTGV
jgi:choice-of-anchor A domain-containing protein